MKGRRRCQNCRSKQIILTPRNLKEVCPEKYKEQEELVCSPWMMGDWVENECGMSEEDAKREASLFAEKLGLDYPVASFIRPLLWGNPPEVISLTGAEGVM